MIFYYDPTIGLSYYSCVEEVFLIEYIPYMAQKSHEEILEEWHKTVRELGVQIIDSTKPSIEEVFIPIYSNVPYELFK